MRFNTAARSIALTFVPALIALLGACATPPPPLEDEMAPASSKGAPTSLGAREGVVFGFLAPVYTNFKGEQVPGSSVKEISYELSYGTAENFGMKRAFSGFTNSIDGSTRQPATFFMLKLPVGEYSFFKLARPFPGTIGSIASDIRFGVAPGKATYIGTLQINFRAGRSIFGEDRPGELVSFKVLDDAEKATMTYKERNPNANFPLETKLMVVNKR